MLSHIIRIATRFEVEHGRRPTLLSLHPQHFTTLREQLGGQPGLDYFCAHLGMNIVLSGETVHPSVYAKDRFVVQPYLPPLATHFQAPEQIG